ncbi:enoyl-CoA hydratase/isomerase family protein [Fulvivirga sediminis]|uniref:Enoyl-CoA hydratase/isomerase family protein n=1 Tax=Fulvivirga sediminis TaxID=2803949 RepID=A0A937K115_9BACT|nr:enoyl-CoA hydratase-related protein [Fulvivirga sediminis]MBL3658898.1 enoyl-CoA hydratase/isomerase family protein [Fulvivirga sediminis]
MYEHLKITTEGGVCTVTLNRPEVYNALNDTITYELQKALKDIGKDDAVRVVVLTGAGKAFCSGQDLKEASIDENKSFMQSLNKRYNPIIRLMKGMPKPIICKLNGVAAGAGCSLALACDIIVAAEEAVLTEVFVNIGLVLDSGSSYFLPRLVGSTKAFELSTMGSRTNGKEAYELGIVNKVVSGSDLDGAVKAYADYYANAPTKAIGLMKKMLNKSGNASLDDMLEYEAYCQEIAGNTHDYKEGVSAFMEKRKPKFSGN